MFFVVDGTKLFASLLSIHFFGVLRLIFILPLLLSRSLLAHGTRECDAAQNVRRLRAPADCILHKKSSEMMRYCDSVALRNPFFRPAILICVSLSAIFLNGLGRAARIHPIRFASLLWIWSYAFRCYSQRAKAKRRTPNNNAKCKENISVFFPW